jgi:hypothetical protein
VRNVNLRRPGLWALAAAVPAIAALLVALAPGFAAGAESPPTTTTKEVIHIKEVKGALRFVGPQTVHMGDDLEIVNETKPSRVGPHTFSLVTKGSLPKTAKARQLCFTPNHICKAIASWHGVKGNGPVTKNPAEAGPAGWSTMGTPHKKGDSWFTGNKPNTSFVQQVTADASTEPKTLYYICAVHAWMQGKVTVLPPGA